MNLSLSDEQMKTLVAKTLMEALTEDARKELITSAITSLLMQPEGKSSNYYGHKEPLLQSIFNNAASMVARQIAEKELNENEEFRAKVKALFVEASAKVFDDPERRGRIVNAVADAMQKSMKLDPY